MLELNVSGSPFELGYQHGVQAKGLIRAYCARVLSFSGLPRDPARSEFRGTKDLMAQVAERLTPRLERRWAERLTELRGIAESSGVPYTDILALNLLAEAWNAMPEACTNIAVMGPDGPLLGKTDDTAEGDEAFLVVQRVRPVQGYSFLQTTYPGVLFTLAGINETGLAIASSALQPLTVNWDGDPALWTRREVLQHCRTVTEGVELLETFDYVNHGLATTVVDAEGNMAVVEKVPTRQAVRTTQQGTLYAANFAACPDVAELVGDPALIANGKARWESLKYLLEVVPHTIEGMKSILCDHRQPGAICQHGQANLYTSSATVAVCREKQLWVSIGPPCLNEFECYSL